MFFDFRLDGDHGRGWIIPLRFLTSVVLRHPDCWRTGAPPAKSQSRPPQYGCIANSSTIAFRLHRNPSNPPCTVTSSGALLALWSVIEVQQVLSRYRTAPAAPAVQCAHFACAASVQGFPAALDAGSRTPAGIFVPAARPSGGSASDRPNTQTPLSSFSRCDPVRTAQHLSVYWGKGYRRPAGAKDVGPCVATVHPFRRTRHAPEILARAHGTRSRNGSNAKQMWGLRERAAGHESSFRIRCARCRISPQRVSPRRCCSCFPSCVLRRAVCLYYLDHAEVLPQSRFLRVDDPGPRMARDPLTIARALKGASLSSAASTPPAARLSRTSAFGTRLSQRRGDRVHALLVNASHILYGYRNSQQRIIAVAHPCSWPLTLASSRSCAPHFGFCRALTEPTEYGMALGGDSMLVPPVACRTLASFNLVHRPSVRASSYCTYFSSTLPGARRLNTHSALSGSQYALAPAGGGGRHSHVRHTWPPTFPLCCWTRNVRRSKGDEKSTEAHEERVTLRIVSPLPRPQ
ncbi:hypothetical protein DFH07DRAFT_970625 [Mycena maculata]|uniref:Uncharacterized protein n=1 Tax=Mycena maculata TaxID=230809 RepID=A0AAD7MQ96_9AGAR|nr:hypothetical protein DFH07DRAFT_970625 [Mycena maculata]